MAPDKSTQEPTRRINRTVFSDLGSEEQYLEIVGDSRAFLAKLVSFLVLIGATLLHRLGCPGGWDLTRHSTYQRRRLDGLPIWRVQCKHCKAVFTVLPHFIVRYRAIRVVEAEQALLGLLGGASFETIALMTGRPAMSLYRMFVSFGQVELVSVLLAARVPPPAYGVPDEKHTWRLGARHYVPLWASGLLIWGIDLAESPTEEDFEPTYAGTVQKIDGACGPRTVRGVVTDGYDPTRKAAAKGSDTLRLGACLGHFRSKFRSWASKVSETLYIEFTKRLKSVLQSDSEPILKVFRFAHRMRALIGWVAKNLGPEFAAELRDRYERHRAALHVSMADPQMPRSSLWADWLCNFLDRKLFMMKYFHRDSHSARRLLKAFAVLHDFKPYGPRAKNSLLSPVEVAGGWLPLDSWLASLQVFSAGGLVFHKPP